MIKKAFNYFWAARVQLMKYFVVGVSTVLLDMVSLIFLKEKAHIQPVLAVVYNQILIMVFNFSLNKFWSFKESVLTHWQVVKYVILTGFNYAFSVSAMYVFNSKMHFDYRLVRVGSIAVVVMWNFLLYKHWIYVERKEEPAV
jgi:putative flippase GtrA